MIGLGIRIGHDEAKLCYEIALFGQFSVIHSVHNDTLGLNIK
jgi:hypothetical protein